MNIRQMPGDICRRAGDLITERRFASYSGSLFSTTIATALSRGGRLISGPPTHTLEGHGHEISHIPRHIMAVRISTAEEYEALLRDYDTWLFDCDGVLWRGDHSIEGVIQVLDMLRRRSTFNSSLRVLFPFEHSLKTRRSYSSQTTRQNRGRPC